MKMIGIESDTYLVYEGNSMWGHAIWPTPELIPACIVDEAEVDFSPKNNSNLQMLPFVFIDEGYDPTSRIRKGRIYEKQESQPNQWHVHPHPATPDDSRHAGRDGVISKSLATFREFNFQPVLKQLDITAPLVVLGSNTQFTVWSVIDVETSISGETILFLKARKTIGVLPRIDYSAFNEKYHDQIRKKLDLLADDIYRAGPDSIVDRTREAASAIINFYLLDKGHISKHKDLGQLVTPLRDKEDKYIAANCIDTIAKLHSRTKHSEQNNKGLRSITESDADLVVQSLYMIILELGWGR